MARLRRRILQPSTKTISHGWGKSQWWRSHKERRKKTVLTMSSITWKGINTFGKRCAKIHCWLPWRGGEVSNLASLRFSVFPKFSAMKICYFYNQKKQYTLLLFFRCCLNLCPSVNFCDCYWKQRNFTSDWMARSDTGDSPMWDGF